MLTYLINISITWIILFVLYKALLEKEKYFTLNRTYLLSSLAMGILLPLISYIPVENTVVLPTITSQINEVYQSQIIAMEAHVSPVISSTQGTVETFSFSWILMFQLIYFLGLGFVMFRLIKSSSNLFRLLSKSQTNKKSTHSEIVVSENILPFSFMKYIFIGNQDYNSDERSNILSHELYHVQSYHSIDVVFVELLKIIFWWHPMVYLYKRAISENHEYAADQTVLAQSSRKQYCQLLMKATLPGINLELTNPFFQTFIKKRITMMYQKESNKLNLLKYVSGIIAIGFIVVIFIKPLKSQIEKYENKDQSLSDLSAIEVNQEDREQTNKGENYNKDEASEELNIIKEEIIENGLVEEVESKENTVNPQMSSQNREEKKGEENYWWKENCKMNKHMVFYELDEHSHLESCPDWEDGWSHARNTLSKFATDNFEWPQEALEEGEERNMYHKIIVDEEGNLTEILPIDFNKENPYLYGLEKEGERLISMMRDEFKFVPGKCNGTAVKTEVSFNLGLEIPENKRHLVKIKDLSNTNPQQHMDVKIRCGGKAMILHFATNMNVPVSLEVKDPDGKIIFNDKLDYIYRKYIKPFDLIEKKNGIYTITSTQDGLNAITEYNVTVFEERDQSNIVMK